MQNRVARIAFGLDVEKDCFGYPILPIGSGTTFILNNRTMTMSVFKSNTAVLDFPMHCDLSQLGAGSDREADPDVADALCRRFRQSEFPVLEKDVIISTRDLSLHHFRSNLVLDFDLDT